MLIDTLEDSKTIRSNLSYVKYWSEDHNTSREYPFIGDPILVPSGFWACLTLIEFEENDYCNRAILSGVIDRQDVWKPLGSEVQYCWSEIVEAECSLTFNVGIGIAVILCNLTKACCMCLT